MGKNPCKKKSLMPGQSDVNSKILENEKQHFLRKLILSCCFYLAIRDSYRESLVALGGEWVTQFLPGDRNWLLHSGSSVNALYLNSGAQYKQSWATDHCALRTSNRAEVTNCQPSGKHKRLHRIWTPIYGMQICRCNHFICFMPAWAADTFKRALFIVFYWFLTRS